MNFGIRGIPLILMKSYLSNRRQLTFVQNMASKINKITCGVPQDSTLGPLFFIVYVNDLPKCFHSVLNYMLMTHIYVWHTVI